MFFLPLTIKLILIDEHLLLSLLEFLDRAVILIRHPLRIGDKIQDRLILASSEGVNSFGRGTVHISLSGNILLALHIKIALRQTAKNALDSLFQGQFFLDQVAQGFGVLARLFGALLLLKVYLSY